MNKIKVIDLLNIISKGEELPKTIRWYDKFYNDYDEISNNYKAFVYERLKNEFWNLNDELEIIEEPKKIEKWGEGALEEMEKCTDYTLEDLQKYIRILAETQNELIDEINNLKEKKDE